jgi:hypothetical protein
METLFGVIGLIAGVYLLLGAVMALYEMIQTDNKFHWKTIFTWLYKIFK